MAERQYMTEPRFTLETTIGSVYCVPTGKVKREHLDPEPRHHIFCATESGSYSVTVRGVDYHVGAHLHDNGFGVFECDPKYTHIGRSDYKDASAAAKRKVMEVLGEEVSEFFKDKQVAFQQAEVARHNNRLRQLETDIEVKEQEVRKLRDEAHETAQMLHEALKPLHPDRIAELVKS